MTGKLEFTTFDVVKILDIKRVKLKDWSDNGFLKPTRTTEDSRGVKLFFDLFEVCCLGVFKNIIADGVSRRLAFQMVESLRNSDHPRHEDRFKKNVAFVFLSKDRVEAYFFSNFGELDAVIENKGFTKVFVYNFRSVRNSILMKIDE